MTGFFFILNTGNLHPCFTIRIKTERTTPHLPTHPNNTPNPPPHLQKKSNPYFLDWGWGVGGEGWGVGGGVVFLQNEII